MPNADYYADYYQDFVQQLANDPQLQGWAKQLPAQITSRFNPQQHAKFQDWLHLLENLPSLTPTPLQLNQALVSVGEKLPEEINKQLSAAFHVLHPWRKGPFSIHGVHIDSEWRSDWKWARLEQQISPLSGRRVLDVGCGNGYYGWRMMGAGAGMVMGIDPTLLHVMQFHASAHFLGKQQNFSVLPLGIEDVPEKLRAFDSVFSMGILYHRRSPIEHLLQLRDCLRPGGELVLETLVIDGDATQVLVPEGRYAKMRNVWFLPSTQALKVWLQRCAYQNIQLLDVTPTRVDEQRRTAWMQFESLADFLDPDDANKTIEGLPAPKRAIFLATAP
ncbi:tRNA 5-methoxyuridine(34)/uridine 5-oxyacetic acid(34) synthase CmoB [Candidatus Venteria ishoeyi]|uniref:tRNA U34 carboxymethyltransferase n=1 Tax=Candidatus Venteria ishoeyi TaxID=1899563 RepID=A0A1H6FBT3_9GAMM|nr:tRNA 5-methoxyuridine(34)/uridine 5-oxyacetic acid(34) synthase CmoB [Candidatus Venteria ishoeyi]SEH06606.1 tRNA (mo5U34)-methyltransferase [Candidatus Venteria ishoeyi]